MMPNKLKDNKFRFIKIASGKFPMEQAWQLDTSKYSRMEDGSWKNEFGEYFTVTDKNTKKQIRWKEAPNNYSWEEIEGWVNSGKNYGVAGGFGNLLVIDFDDDWSFNKIRDSLPETFIVKSGGKSLHYYYIVDDPTSFNMQVDTGEVDESGRKKKRTLIDFQGVGKQVIGPGSLHSSGKRYEVHQDNPICKISREWLMNLIKRKFPYSMWPSNLKREKNNNSDLVVEKIKENVRIIDYDQTLNLGKQCCPFHSDKTPSFSVFDDGRAFNCYSGCGGGDIFNYVMMKESCDFLEALKKLKKHAGIEDILPVQIESEPNTLKFQVAQLLAARKRLEAIQLIVDHILGNKNIYTTRDDEKSEMWTYIKGIYVPQGRTYLKELCSEILGQAYTSHIVNQIIAKVEVETYINQKDFFINEDVNLVPVQNGVLHLKNRELLPFKPKYRFFNKLPITYNESAECPAIKEFVSQILLTDSDKLVVQELFGYLLYRDYNIEKAFMFHGSGRNGKSKLIELMKRFIGVDNCANITLQSLDKDNFAMGELFNKMANLAADLPSTRLVETGNFKSLTGHDLISAPRKFLTRVNFVNYAKMIFSANELPDTPDATEAFFLRWVVVDFPFTFLSEKEMKTKEDKTNCKLADKSIIDKISTDEELSGLLNWALDGLQRLLSKGDFSYAKGAEDVKKHWMRKSSSVVAFIQDCLDVKYGGLITRQDLQTAYWLYCKDTGLEMESNKDLNAQITKRLPVIMKRVSSLEGNPRCWEGITFNQKSGLAKKLEDLNRLSLYE